MPDGLPYLAALALAALFALSAVAKWRDLPGTARAFRALGVPRPWTAVRVVPGSGRAGSRLRTSTRWT